MSEKLDLDELAARAQAGVLRHSEIDALIAELRETSRLFVEAKQRASTRFGEVQHNARELRRVEGERDVARAVIDRVREMHVKGNLAARMSGTYHECRGCLLEYPCPTAVALGPAPTTGEGDPG